MQEKHLHIVSFNVPYPPDYGGVIDVFYKIKALHELGIKVHLHCFTYGRDQAPELAPYCETINYYERKKFYQAIYSSVPYIVGSRKSGELLSAISQDNYPILFEGLHTCLYLTHPALKDKLKAVRMHNVEWEYYKSLGSAERNYLLKFYFNIESMRLKKFEGALEHANKIFAISHNDYDYLRQTFEQISYVPAFHSNEKVAIQPGKGNFILYHGNLSVVENNQAAIYILKKLAENSSFKFKIAGKNPTDSLKKEIKKYKNVELIANPSFEVLGSLIENAHINLLPTFQQTGIKLKLLNALYRGRFCVVNTKMIQQTGLEPACICEDNPAATTRILESLMQQTFTQEMVVEREQILNHTFSNKVNAQKIIDELF